MPGVPDHDPGRGEQRVVVPPELLPPQVIDPFDDDVTDVVADRKEPGGERLRELRVHLPGVLVEPALIDVEVLELKGRNGPIAGAVRMVKATSARSRRSISVPPGIVRMTCSICSSVGALASRYALATLVSLADRLKYSASE